MHPRVLLFLLIALSYALPVLNAQEAAPLPPSPVPSTKRATSDSSTSAAKTGPQVYVLTNDNSFIQGQLEGFFEGYLSLRFNNRSTRFSPKDFRAIFFTEAAAREALKRYLQSPDGSGANTPSDRPRTEDAQPIPSDKPAAIPTIKASEETDDTAFLKAMREAKTRAIALRESPNPLIALQPVMQEAFAGLRTPDYLLDPEKAKPLLILCALPVRPKQAEKLSEHLDHYKSLVEESTLTGDQKERIRSRLKQILRQIAIPAVR